MWTTIALLAALGLAPGEAGQLELTNVRLTHGMLGPPPPPSVSPPARLQFMGMSLPSDPSSAHR